MKITVSYLVHLIRLYDNEEISISRMAELINEVLNSEKNPERSVASKVEQ